MILAEKLGQSQLGHTHTLIMTVMTGRTNKGRKYYTTYIKHLEDVGIVVTSTTSFVRSY